MDVTSMYVGGVDDAQETAAIEAVVKAEEDPSQRYILIGLLILIAIIILYVTWPTLRKLWEDDIEGKDPGVVPT